MSTGTQQQQIEAGDTVYHGPTGEEWYVLGVYRDRDIVCVAGWPSTVARLGDCTLVSKGKGLTEAQRQSRDRTFGGGWDD